MTTKAHKIIASLYLTLVSGHEECSGECVITGSEHVSVHVIKVALLMVTANIFWA